MVAGRVPRSPLHPHSKQRQPGNIWTEGREGGDSGWAEPGLGPGVLLVRNIRYPLFRESEGWISPLRTYRFG